jgi:hypothetical protein
VWPVQAGPVPGSGLVQPMPSAQTRSIDQGALQEAKVGALIGIFGLILSVVGDYLAFSYGALGIGASCNSVTDTCSFPSVSVAVSGALLGLTVVGYIIAILFILRFRSAFQKLVTVDFRFRSPANLAILAIVGIGIVILAEILLGVAAIDAINACKGGVYTTCYNAITGEIGLLLGGLGLLVLGAILLLIGGILVLIGIWRMGTRYNQSLIKVGAILLIIPFLDIVGVILIYVGANQALTTLNATGGGMMGSGALPFSPPPGAH